MSQPTTRTPEAPTPIPTTCTSCSCTSDLMPCTDCGVTVCPAHAVVDEYGEQAWCLSCAEAYLE